MEKYLGEISDPEERAYYSAQYYAQKKDPKLVKEFETLLKSEKYKAYASKALGDYYFDKNDLAKSKTSFSFTTIVLSSGSSTPNNLNIIIVFAFPTTFNSG